MYVCMYVHMYVCIHVCMYILWCFFVGVSCGEPDVPTSAGTSFGDVARYSCDTGYTLNGPAERTCQADGQWSESVPTCESE